MKIIGITGGTGAGKSLLSAELGKLGAEIIDADKIAREITTSQGLAFEEIIQNFGSGVLSYNGELDRKKLAEIIFTDLDKKALLERITHKYIFEEMKRRIAKSSSNIVVLDVPLLFQCDFPIKCDLTVAVIADKTLRLSRIVERDKISKVAAESRMKNQLSDEEYKCLADMCFENSGDKEKIRAFAEDLCKK